MTSFRRVPRVGHADAAPLSDRRVVCRWSSISATWRTRARSRWRTSVTFCCRRRRSSARRPPPTGESSREPRRRIGAGPLCTSRRARMAMSCAQGAGTSVARHGQSRAGSERRVAVVAGDARRRGEWRRGTARDALDLAHRHTPRGGHGSYIDYMPHHDRELYFGRPYTPIILIYTATLSHLA